ncbi:hypothetical protein EFK50_01415 [Nocardioides marmoriginsengisoli]|uniref:Uncharacterized protein n=1 Tax=Nocardioides marmoriginsengisoli TaxID=661483 RepID=A0A3N0CQJ9_9ACTN|nr:hypothetical protein [Nocardioides marmoriginsengisoli]RNL65735.1 hypothetical protein EFK50_01415 [Nocardioides marmoriginsengisoli]
MAAVLCGKFRGFKNRSGVKNDKSWSMDFAGVEIDGEVCEVLLGDGDEKAPWPAIGELVAVAVKVSARGNFPSYNLRAVLPDPEMHQVHQPLGVAW